MSRSQPHTSFSQLDQYRRCSLAYYFKYVKGERTPGNLNIAKGKAGPAAIEKNHRAKAKTTQQIPRDELIQTFVDTYDGMTYNLELADGEDLGKTKDDTIDSLNVYHGTTGKKIQPVAVELGFNLDLPATEDYEYPIRIINGRIDLVDRAGILDAKFANRRKSQADVDDSWQLTLYDMVFKDLTGMDTPNMGFMAFLPPGTGKTPKPAEVQVLLRSPHEVEPAQRQRRRDRLEHVLRTTQKAIDAGIFMPADDPKVCSYCDFRKTCKSSLAKDDFAAIAIRQKG